MREKRIIRSLKWRGSLLLLAAVGGWFGLTAHAVSDTQPGPCVGDPQSRQLDYWLGNWTMTKPGDSGSSTSKVYLSLDQCVFIEHWENGKGHVAEKMFAYSPDDKNWYGMFADNEGRAHIFLEGKVTSGIAEFHGPSRGPNGEAVLNKLSVVRVLANKVEETWQKSTDNGASWTTVYRAEYTRANP